MIKKKLAGLLLCGLLALGLLGTVQAGQAYTSDISTMEQWNGTQSISSFGQPNTATYGQVVVAPEGTTQLRRFTFKMRATSVAPSIFRAYVMAWDGVKSQGPVLFTSDVISVAPNANYQDVTIDTGNVAVQPGAAYVLFFNCSTTFDGANDSARYASVSNNSYDGGEFVYLNNGTDFAALSNTSWNLFGSDLAFSAEFGPVVPGAVAGTAVVNVAGRRTTVTIRATALGPIPYGSIGWSEPAARFQFQSARVTEVARLGVNVARVRGLGRINGGTTVPYELVVFDGGSDRTKPDTVSLRVPGLPNREGAVATGNLIVSSAP